MKIISVFILLFLTSIILGQWCSNYPLKNQCLQVSLKKKDSLSPSRYKDVTGTFCFEDKKKGVMAEGNFEKGYLLDGREYIYDSFGLLEKINVFKDGKFVSFNAAKKHKLIENDTLNQLDKDGKKMGYWVIRGEDRNLPDYCDTCIVEEGIYIRSRKQGVWIKYWENGNVKSRVEFNLGRANGYFEMYYESGCMEESGIWKNGKYEEHSRFYESGCIQSLKVFSPAKTELIYYFDDCDTTIYGSIDSSNAKIFNEKELNCYDNLLPLTFETKGNYSFTQDSLKQDSKSIDTSTIKINSAHEPIHKVVKDGYHKLFDENGNLSMDGEFKNARFWNGKRLIYDDFGLLDHIEIYKEGKYVGNGVIE